MNTLDYIISTTIGVVVGTLITLLADLIKQKMIDLEQRKYFKYELEINISKINEWLEGINQYRNHANSDTLELFNFYFDLSKFISGTADLLFKSGKIYKILEKTDIKDFQVIAQELSLGWENILNSQVQENKKNFDKKKTIQNIMFWEDKLKSHRDRLKIIVSKI